MKIEGSGLNDLCELKIKLHSTDMNCHCQFDRSLAASVFDHDSTACIEFRDSYEIDQLIEILLRFKDHNRKCFGEW